MALQVWLPLTKDLRNQGVSSVAVTNTGVTFSTTEGKLGGSAYFNGSSRLQLPLPSSMTTIKNTTVAAWVKSISSTLALGGISHNSTPDYYMPECTLYTSGWQTGTGSGWGYISGGTVANTNVWHHVACTISDTDVTTYLDGVQVATKTLAAWGMTSFELGSGHFIEVGSDFPGGDEYLTGYINDFRIYDHCLSPLEVKQISQGLVLHYPLNRNGWGQENLVNNSDFSNLSTTGTVIRDDTVLFHGHSTCKINRTGATANTYTGWTSQNLFSRLTPSTKVTVSVWMYRESTHGIDAGCEWRMYQRYNNDASTDWTGFFSSANWPIGEWKKFTYTYTVRSDISSAYLNFNVVKNGTYWFAEPKIEVGEIATSWTPSSTDALATTMGLNSTTEYDCSGFCNNGTRVGTLGWSSNTAKYAVSTKFNGTDNAIQTPSLPTMITDKNYTIAVWIYKTIIGSKGYQTIYGGPSGFEIEARNGSANETKFVPWNWGKPMASYELNEWNHCVFVHSDADCKIYLNGEYIATGTAKASNPTGNYFIGAWNTATQQNFDGLMSDFRIYATALSASDVKSLYQNCATIDADGTIHGQIRS